MELINFFGPALDDAMLPTETSSVLSLSAGAGLGSDPVMENARAENGDSDERKKMVALKRKWEEEDKGKGKGIVIKDENFDVAGRVKQARGRYIAAQVKRGKEKQRKIMEEMPTVKADRPDGRRVEGFLYKYMLI